MSGVEHVLVTAGTGCPTSGLILGRAQSRAGRFFGVGRCYRAWYRYRVAKIRRGNYVFLTWKGDHGPRHIHVYRDGRFVLKWNLDDHASMKGHATARVLALHR